MPAGCRIAESGRINGKDHPHLDGIGAQYRSVMEASL